MTMKTTLRGAITVLGIGSSSAHADGCASTTLFTSIPGEQSSRAAAAPGRVTIVIPDGAVARRYMTTSRRGNRLFLPAPDSAAR
jgi:hypothetical protein